MKILAIDLGKFNSVACLFDTTTNQRGFETLSTVEQAEGGRTAATWASSYAVGTVRYY